MAQTTNIICDGCGKVVDIKNGSLSFAPIRGGLNFVATNSVGNAATMIDKRLDFCGGDCFNTWAQKTVAKIAKAKT